LLTGDPWNRTAIAQTNPRASHQPREGHQVLVEEVRWCSTPL